jgi:hypothetical protein
MQVSYMVDPDLQDRFNMCFPGLPKAAQITIALRLYIQAVNDNKITVEDIMKEVQRVQDRKFGRI